MTIPEALNRAGEADPRGDGRGGSMRYSEEIIEIDEDGIVRGNIQGPLREK